MYAGLNYVFNIFLLCLLCWIVYKRTLTFYKGKVMTYHVIHYSRKCIQYI